MADPSSPPDAVFRILIQADIQRVWHELIKTDEAQGAVFNAWLHTTRLVPATGHPADVRRVRPARICAAPTHTQRTLAAVN